MGEDPARLAIRGRIAASVEQHALLAVGVVWAIWLAAVLGVVIGGVEAGAISDPHHSWLHYGGPLWPLFTWDFGWYRAVAEFGYPHGHGGPFYAFFPLWPLVLRASGSIPDWAASLAVVRGGHLGGLTELTAEIDNAVERYYAPKEDPSGAS